MHDGAVDLPLVANGVDDLADIVGDDFTPRAVAGLSLFWDTPLGPLRFNFTEPLIAEDYDEPQNFDLTVSTQF